MSAQDVGLDIRITPLGAGREVGRSCVLVSIGDVTVMCDCGMHMGFQDHRSVPDFSFICEGVADRRAEMTKRIDAVLISHFHLDHCGALPVLTEVVGYDGPVIMTQPTRAIAPLLLEDMRRIQGSRSLWSQADLLQCVERVTPIGLRETIEIKPGLKVTAYYAGHVIGACMFHIEVGSQSVLYTGDYNMQSDRHLTGARVDPGIRPTVLITETTYGTTVRDSKRQRERDFLRLVHDSVASGGKVLVPVFALGRAQDLLILLETYWTRMGLDVPIYFASAMVRRSNDFYKLFVDWTSEVVQGDGTRNIFDFPHVHVFEDRLLEEDGPMVLFSTPGMLHGGLSLRAFKAWCHSPRNAVIIPGFCTQGTLGHDILTTTDRTVTVDGEQLTFNCVCKWMSLSAHADARGIMKLVQTVRPKHVVLVHGEVSVMKYFKQKLTAETGLPCSMPSNGATTRVEISPLLPVLMSQRLVSRAQAPGAEAAVTALHELVTAYADTGEDTPALRDADPAGKRACKRGADDQWWRGWGAGRQSDSAGPSGPCDVDCGCDFCLDTWKELVHAEISAGRPQVGGVASKYAVADDVAEDWGVECEVEASAVMGPPDHPSSVVLDKGEWPVLPSGLQCKFTAKLRIVAAGPGCGPALDLTIRQCIPTVEFSTSGTWGEDWQIRSASVVLSAASAEQMEMVWEWSDAALAKRMAEVAADTMHIVA
eukprot:TRINITY_DN17249_c0_g2_i1.p1 TRINITY_DN17249_c0_g2~~TRINITY_DN17249_c0_g2_i1.p1  ORF type:complete len:707 (+),score=228.19 TRINITY_DN17249_c0_g2_i1:55-2175(+)